MTHPTHLFLAASAVAVAPVWFLMIARPDARLTRRLVTSERVILVPVALYGLFMLTTVGPHLADLRLGTGTVLVVAWMHFLPFDLFVGRWIYLDASRRGLRHWRVGPALLLTMFLGPFGFGAYTLLARVPTRVAAMR